MQLDYLKYIIAVKQYGSINKAAEKLYISQQYISKVLKTMEHESGKTLFVRSNHGVELTVDGEKVYQFAMKYTQMRNTLDEELTLRYLRDIKGNLRIGAVNTASAMVLPQILCRYYHDYPNIKIEVIAGDTDEMLEMFLQNEIDLAIIINAQIKGEEYLKIPENCKCDVLCRGKVCYWVSTHSILSALNEVKMTEIVKYPAVVQNKFDIKMMKAIYKAFGQELKIALNSENPYLIQKFTSEDYGVTPDMAIIGDEWMQKYIFEGKSNVKAVPLAETEDYESSLCLLTVNNKNKSVLERHVTQFILEGRWKE